MSDENDEQETTALVPVAELPQDEYAGLPVVDWRGMQRALWKFDDWLQDNVKPLLDSILDAWQRSGLAGLFDDASERERIQQRQRITAAKRRARIVTRAKGSRRHA